MPSKKEQYDYIYLVIRSCKTHKHLASAKKMIENFKKQYVGTGTTFRGTCNLKYVLSLEIVMIDQADRIALMNHLKQENSIGMTMET